MNHILHRNRITEIRIQFYFLIRKKKKKTSPAVVHGNAKETELPKNKLPIKKTKHNRRIEGTNEETRGREKYGGRVTNNIILIKKKKIESQDGGRCDRSLDPARICQPILHRAAAVFLITSKLSL